MYYILLLFTLAVVSVTSQDYKCDYPALYDYPAQYNDYTDQGYFSPQTPTTTKAPPKTGHVHHHHHHTRPPTATGTVTPRPTPSRINTVSSDVPFATVISKAGDDMNSIQQTQMKELYCLEVLDNLLSSRWQEDIDRVSVSDLGNFSTQYKAPDFSYFYSNPVSEYIQSEGKPLNKLDQCFRNLVSKVVPRMDQAEIRCLNSMYPDYLTRENKVAKMMDTYIAEDSRKEPVFRSVYTYHDITEVLFGNKREAALDSELKSVDEDINYFYIKSEEDKTKKIFVIEQECKFEHVRQLREVKNENERYQKFGKLVKSHVNRYLVAAILWDWVPGVIIPEYRYNLWRNARDKMDEEIRDEVNKMQQQRADAQLLCTYAAQFAGKFFEQQKAILFDNMKTEPLSSLLKTRGKYAYAIGLADVLAERNDNRLSHTQVLLKEFTEGHNCLASFVQMVENHQRYMIATAFVGEMLPYGITYCYVKEDAVKLVNPRYCKCQGTFCEKFGLATIRAERYELVLLPNGTYAVRTKPSYRVDTEDVLVGDANKRIEQEKFGTWWYKNLKKPHVPIVFK